MALIIALLIGLVSFLVHNDSFRNLDYQSMVSFQKISHPFLDHLFSVFTLMGSTESTFLIVSLIFFSIFIFKKKAAISVYLYILIYPVELLGKMMIYHPKPPIFLNRYVFDFHLPSSFIVETSYSYPSGHMARAAFICWLLFFLIKRSKLNIARKRLFRVVIFIYLATMFVSRIYLGEHWFSDVLGGTLLGFFVGFISLVLW